MPAPLKTALSAEELDTLHELRVANSVHHRVRDRVHMVLLNADGGALPKLPISSNATNIPSGQRSSAGRHQGYTVCERKEVVDKNRPGMNQI
ncbi:MAG: hypothetical protein AAF703_22480 [Cyanobacteria bacterium P01_D01_bin.105]